MNNKKVRCKVTKEASATFVTREEEDKAKIAEAELMKMIEKDEIKSNIKNAKQSSNSSGNSGSSSNTTNTKGKKKR